MPGGTSAVLEKLSGNTGTAVPDGSHNITIVTANSSPIFAASGSTLTLDFALTTNLLLGATGASITGSNNTAFGVLALSRLLTGSQNSAFGSSAGYGYTGAESSNICIGNQGTTGDANAIRIGTQGSGSGQQNACYVAGIQPSSVTGSVVNISSTGRLGSLAFGSSGQVLTSTGAGSSPTWQTPAPVAITLTGDSGGALSGTSFTITGGSTSLMFAGAGTTLTLGGTLRVANGGTGAATLTGILIGNGTSSVTASTATQYNVLVGGASNAVANVAPSATSGVPLVSGGSSANPSFGTAVVAGGGTGATTLTGVLTGNGTSAITASAVTQYGILIGGASNAVSSTTLTNGQLLIGSTSVTPAAATLTAGVGIGITNGAGAITIAATGGGLTWSTVTGSTQAMTSGNAYVCNYAGQIAFTLPTTSNVGDFVAVVNTNTAAGWKITYTTNQQIFAGASACTLTSGSLAASALGDNVVLVCTVANLKWYTFGGGFGGNLTIA